MADDGGAALSLGALLLQIPALGTMIVNQLAVGAHVAGPEAVTVERALVSLAQCSKALYRTAAGALKTRQTLRSGRPVGRAKVFCLQSEPCLGLGLGRGRGRGRGQSDVAVVATKRLHDMYSDAELDPPGGDDDEGDHPAWLADDSARSVYQREALVGIPLAIFYSRRGIDSTIGLPGARHLDLVIGHEDYRAVDIFVLVDSGDGQLCAMKTHCEYGYMLPMAGWAAIETHGLGYFHAFPDMRYCHVSPGSKLWQHWLPTRPGEGHHLYVSVESLWPTAGDTTEDRGLTLMDALLREQPGDAEWEPDDAVIGWSSVHPLMM